MNSLSKLERDILATLEEAGEDDIAALLNTVRVCQGSSAEVDAFRAALVHLVETNFMDLATSRDETAQHWISMQGHVADSVLNGLGTVLYWSDVDQVWKFADGLARLEVLLTDAGLVAARQILSQNGWPTRQPWGSVEKAQRQ